MTSNSNDDTAETILKTIYQQISQPSPLQVSLPQP